MDWFNLSIKFTETFVLDTVEEVRIMQWVVASGEHLIVVVYYTSSSSDQDEGEQALDV